MQHFSMRLDTKQGNLHFYFNRIVGTKGIHYHVSVIGTDYKAYLFNMVERGGQWIIDDPDTCPSWIVEMEQTFEREISLRLKSGT